MVADDEALGEEMSVKDLTPKEKFLYILNEVEYELNDGINIPYKGRTFNTQEREDIKGIIELVRRTVNFYAEKGEL